MKITIKDSTFDHVGTVLKAHPDADIEFSDTGSKYSNIGRMFDFTDGKNDEVTAFLASLPSTVTQAQVHDVMTAVKAAPATTEAREAAVKGSGFWNAVKEMGPEIVAKTIMVAIDHYTGG